MMEAMDSKNTMESMEAARDSKTHLYAMDPTTTLFTFLLQTDSSVNTVRLLGSWDNFSMTYTMERDSRRDRGQWRGCHTFNDIICDGDAPTNQAPRSGGLKMGKTYYYYYEVDGSIETHDPTVPSTSICPYLPGQRVNTLWVPIEQSTRQRSASVNSMRNCDFKTMNPADKFVTPRPPPATPFVVAPSPPPASATANPERRPLASSSANKRPLSPLPSSRHLLRHQRSVRSLSPASSLSTWSPRRLFARRASPSREVTLADKQQEEDEFVPSSVDSRDDNMLQRPAPPPRMASSSSTSSFSSVSRLRLAALAPATYYPSSSSQGSRSRDISPESLRRFLVDDVPFESAAVPAVAVDTSVAGHNTSFFLSETDDEDDDLDIGNIDNDTTTSKSHDLNFIDDDEHNFATSTTSESAPMTILSPPPPPSRTITPPKAQEEEKLVQAQQDDASTTVVVEESSSVEPLPEAPTRVPPAIPMPTLEPTVAPVASELELSVEAADETSNNIQLDLPRLTLNLELPSMLSPPSPMSLSPMSLSSLSGALSFQSPESRGLSSVAHSDVTDDDEENDADPLYSSAASEPIALFLPPPEHPFQGESSKADSQQHQHRHHRHHLMDAALTGSTATLVPGNGLIGAGNGSGLDDLVDELGWMATAIQG